MYCAIIIKQQELTIEFMVQYTVLCIVTSLANHKPANSDVFPAVMFHGLCVRKLKQIITVLKL